MTAAQLDAAGAEDEAEFVATEYQAECLAAAAADPATHDDATPEPRSAPHSPARLEILVPGALSTCQDLGRQGMGGLGVGVSGAADRPAAALANRLVGNRASAAVIEVTFGGLRFRARGRMTFAVTGASLPLTIRGAGGASRLAACSAAVPLRDGDEVSLGTPAEGLRSYVAFRGGLDAGAVLGSRSTDLLSGLGPEPLSAGQVLGIGADVGAWPPVGAAPPDPAEPAVPRLDVIFGPRADWFTDGSRDLLLSQEWEVQAESNRVGARLSGPTPLERAAEGELPSEGMVPGSLQVPPNGQLVLFLADHPVTGGYPVIGVVPTADVFRAAQLPPGRKIRFRARPDSLMP